MIITKYYYTLKELVAMSLNDVTILILPADGMDVPFMQQSSDPAYSSISYFLYADFGLKQRYYTISNEYRHINELFEIIFSRYSEQYVFKSDEEFTIVFDFFPVTQESYPVRFKTIGAWWTKFFSIYRLTCFKYNELIDYYNNAKSKLMDGIKSTSGMTNRANDTPLNGGDYSDDPHTSYFGETQAIVTEERDSPIARLDEINNKLNNIYLSWTNEFSRIFMEV